MNEHEWNFIENFGLLIERKGGTRSLGRVFGYLLLADRPKTLDEVADDLLFSKATASLTIRQGVVGGFVERVSIPGERKIFFRVNLTSWVEMTVEQIKWISEWDRMIGRVLEDIDPGNEMAIANLKDFKEYLEFLQWSFSDLSSQFESWKMERKSHKLKPLKKEAQKK